MEFSTVVPYWKETVVKIPDEVKKKLKKLSTSRTEESRLVERAKMVLKYLEGKSFSAIARELGTTRLTVSLWVKRFKESPSISSLQDNYRSGTPPSIPPSAKALLVALACSRPCDVKGLKTEAEILEASLSQGLDQEKEKKDEKGEKNSHSAEEIFWTLEELTKKVEEVSGQKISKSYAGKILKNLDIRPHKKKMWLHSPDPDFLEKVKAICGIYLNPDEEETVICVDEKTGMQATEKKYETTAAAPGVPVREEYEYIRHGTQTLIAGFDIRTGQVYSVCQKTRTADDLLDFMENLSQQIDGKITIIWDNLNIHKGKRWDEFNERHGGRFSFIYTPLHASWLNQIEIWFGILHRKILRGGSFGSECDLKNKVSDFIENWNLNNKKAFNWKFNGIFN